MKEFLISEKLLWISVTVKNFFSDIQKRISDIQNNYFGYLQNE